MVHELVAEPKQPTINLAIGPMCPVRCEGCYTHFGNTSSLGGLITAYEVIAFAGSAQAEGVSQATLSGGDPLFHPEIVAIARGLTELGLKVKLDTVGTALLGPELVTGAAVFASFAPYGSPGLDFAAWWRTSRSQKTTPMSSKNRHRKVTKAEKVAIARAARAWATSGGSSCGVMNRTTNCGAEGLSLSLVRLDDGVPDGTEEWLFAAVDYIGAAWNSKTFSDAMAIAGVSREGDDFISDPTITVTAT
jgi:hypothetical protein